MQKASILIVEDENIVAEDLRQTLENLGYAVAGVVNNGSDAIKIAENANPDLILMDINIKGEMDGIETTKKISASLDIPVIFLTAYGSNNVIDMTKRTNAYGYLVKPFEEKNLNSTIRMALQKHREVQQMKIKDEADLDLYDRKILHLLDANSRITASEIGTKLRLPKATVNYRINRLLDSGYLKKFYAVVNVSALGYQYYRISAKFRAMTPELETSIMNFVSKDGNCLSFRVLQGQFDSVIFTAHRDLETAGAFMEKFTKKFGSHLTEKEVELVSKTYKFGQKFLLETKDYRITQIKLENSSKVKIDKTDEKILNILSNEARTKLIDIANKLKLDWKVVKYRIRKLEKSGLIAGYTTEINIPKLKQEIVQVDISFRDPSAIQNAINFFNSKNACFFAHELLGRHDLTVDLCVSNEEMLKDIVDGFKKAFADRYLNCDISRVYNEHIINSLQL